MPLPADARQVTRLVCTATCLQLASRWQVQIGLCKVNTPGKHSESSPIRPLSDVFGWVLTNVRDATPLSQSVLCSLTAATDMPKFPFGTSLASEPSQTRTLDCWRYF